MAVRTMSIVYEMNRYRSKSIARPPILIGDFSMSDSPKSRNGYGYPIAIETPSLPEISESSGNVNMASKSARRNRNPKMAPIFFVGMSCLGNALPMISARLSFPANRYAGFFVLID